MPSTRFTFTVHGEAIRPRGFAEAVRLIAQLLDDIDAALSRNNQTTMIWHVEPLVSGSVVVPYIGTPKKPDIAPNLDVPRICVLGVQELERHPTKPTGFEFDAIGRIHTIGRIITNGISGFSVDAPDTGETSEITPRSLANAQIVIGQAYAYGAIEGRLEAVNVHGQFRFTVWDAVTGRGVTCHFDEEMIDDVFAALRSKVMVVGRVRRDPDGTPREIRRITEFRRLGAPERPRSVIDLEGVYAEMEGDTLDYLAEIRGE